jgi:hypothetical protein
MATIDKTGIVSSQTIQAAHITNIIDALDGTAAREIIATGGVTGSLLGNVRGNITGSITGAVDATVQKLVGSSITSNVSVSTLISGKFYEVSAATGTVTITLDNLFANGAGKEFEFVATNLTNPIAFVTGSGVTIVSEDGNLKMNKVGSGAFVKYVSGTTCYLIGSLKA